MITTPYKVLSYFDGISCARMALNKAGIPIGAYLASEIDEYAIQVAQRNFPDTIQIGDVQTVKDRFSFGGTLDLLIGGSPCQDLSIAKRNRQGLDGERSGLFWTYLETLRRERPTWFVLENVASMPKEAKDIISRELGVEPIMIDAGLVSAQRRKRLFWTNIPGVTQPTDREIYVKDILEPEVDEKYYISEETLQSILEKMRQGRSLPQSQRIYSTDGKSVALQAGGGGTGAKTGLYLIIPEATKKGYATAYDGDAIDLSFPGSRTRRGRVGNKVKNLMTKPSINVFTGNRVRRLTPIECERLQSLPDSYTEMGSDNQRYKTLGNAFNVDVVAHILKHIPK